MRILLAEPHSKVSRALQSLIAEKTEHVIAGRALDWDDLLEQEKIAKPDLVLLDWDLPGRSDQSIIAALRAVDCSPRVIVLSTRSDVKERAMKAGADAFVSKGDSPKRLLDALDALQG